MKSLGAIVRFAKKGTKIFVGLTYECTTLPSLKSECTTGTKFQSGDDRPECLYFAARRYTIVWPVRPACL